MKQKQLVRHLPAVSFCLFVLLILIIGFLFIRCSKDNETEKPDPTKTPLYITGTIAGLTKASETGFEDGDIVGIYVVDYTDASTPGILAQSGNRATNVKHAYKASNNTWQPDAGSEIYWKDETTKVDVYGYYPLSATSSSSVTQYPFSVQADQSTARNGSIPKGYEASDFLWGKAGGNTPSSTPVPLTFYHRLSKIVITLIGGTGFESGLPITGISVKVLGTKTASTVDLSTGQASVQASANAQTITTWQDGAAYKAILIPQAIIDNTPLIEVTIGDQTFIHKTGYTFLPNKQHNFSITISKTKMDVSSDGISPWENDQPTHEGEATPISERDALIAFYKSTNGAQWANTQNCNWCTNDPLNLWDGVTIDENGHVIKLEFSDNNLTGTLPASIENLKYLQVLSIERSIYGSDPPKPSGCITGPIPAAIGKLTNLTQLSLYNQQLTGSIPNEIGNLTHLTSLILNNNQLSGEIPPEIGNLASLTRLHLDFNQLSGNLPVEIGNLFELTLLSIANNKLTGAIPEQIGNLTKLTSLNFGRWDYTNDPPYSNNQFSSLPSSIGNLSNLTILYIVGSQLSTLPDEIGNLTNLQTLWLNNNQISSLPASIGSLSKLKELRLSLNKLTSLPNSITNLDLQSLFVDHNFLTGTVPLLGKASLYQIDFSYNQFDKLPKNGNIGYQLSNLNLSNNNLIGNLPSWLGGGNLFLSVSNNRFSGEIPDIIRNNPNWNKWEPSINIFPQQEGFGFTNIGIGENSRDREALIALFHSTNGENWTHHDNWCSNKPIETWYGVTTDANGVCKLQLNNNQLSGVLPQKLENLINLINLDLGRNALTGNIPHEIGNLKLLTYLNLHQNLLDGQIPMEINNLINLTALNFSNNRLTENIPSSIGALVNLTQLSLSDNNLTGTIPATLANILIRPHISFDIRRNRLSGEIPEVIKALNWAYLWQFFSPQQDGYGFTNLH